MAKEVCRWSVPDMGESQRKRPEVECHVHATARRPMLLDQRVFVCGCVDGGSNDRAGKIGEG